MNKKDEERKELRNLRIFAIALLLLAGLRTTFMLKTTQQQTTKGNTSWTKKY